MIYSLDRIAEAAKSVISSLNDYRIVCFEGEMGAGKTTLIKEICAQLGVKDEMSSPTFAIVNEYQAEMGNSIYHFDLYRLESEEEAYNIGIEDYFYSGSLCMLEWAGRIESLIPEDYLEISIKLVNDNQRELMITPHGG